MGKLQIFVKLVEAETLATLNKRFPESLDKHPDMWVKDSKVTTRPGKKYTKVDVGPSGKYMVVNDTGEIFGIKGYGVIHRGHQYGTLDTVDEWHWGECRAIKKQA